MIKCLSWTPTCEKDLIIDIHNRNTHVLNPSLFIYPLTRETNYASGGLPSLWISAWDESGTWRHQMETFSTLLALCAGNSPVPGEFPAQRPVTRSFDVFFDLRPDKRLSKQSWGWWFERPSRPLWRHHNETEAVVGDSSVIIARNYIVYNTLIIVFRAFSEYSLH